MSAPTLSPSDLPDIETLRMRLQSVAMLDAIVMPEWELRYYSYNAHWSEGEEMASMRNGSGDGFHALFTSAGAVIKGVDRDLGSCAEPPYAELPPELRAFADEPAFEPDDATFCVWRRRTDAAWAWMRANPKVDLELLRVPVRGAAAYLAWAKSYYEKDISPALVELVFAHKPVSAEVLTSTAPDCDVDAVFKDAREIGFPIVESESGKKKRSPSKAKGAKKPPRKA